MAATPLTLDYSANTYLALTLTPTSPLILHPADLPRSNNQLSTLSYVGNVGALQDVHLYSVPKSTFETVKDQVLAILDGMQDVVSIDIQVPKQRAKRAGGEL